MKKSDMIGYLRKAQDIVDVDLLGFEPEDAYDKGKYHAAWQKGFEMCGDYVSALHHELIKDRCEGELLEKGFGGGHRYEI